MEKTFLIGLISLAGIACLVHTYLFAGDQLFGRQITPRGKRLMVAAEIITYVFLATTFVLAGAS